MGKRVIDEEMRLTVIINGDSAQKELFDIEKANQEIVRSQKALRAEKAKLASQGKKNTVEYKNLTAEIKQNNTTLVSNKARMKLLQEQIGITSLSMRQLQQRSSQLRLQLLNMVPGSADYKRYEADLKQVNAQLTKLRLGSKGAESSISRLAGGFNKYAALGASAIATGAGLVLSIQKIIDYNGELSDSQSNVQKTTGLTAKEVDELSKKFGMFKTRTARIELLKLAEEAGRLGKEGVDDVLAFVKVANQIKVALGDDLGDEQIREVGKMVTIYKVAEKEGKNFEEAMLALGSSINEVSASGANQASFLVDFIKRTGGISDVANIAAQDMIGLAAAFDEAGQTQEISATAINKFFGSAAKDVSAFANVAGVSIKEYSRLLEEDANEALILFLKGLKQGNPSLEEMAVRLDGIELGGTRGAQAIGALAANIENLEDKQAIANNSLKEATSLTDEYNLKNNNLAASIEKVRKKLLGAFASETIVNGLNDLVVWFAKFIGASEDADGSVTNFRNNLVAFLKAVIIVTAALFSYNTAVKLTALLTGGLDKTTRLYLIVQKVLAARTALLTAGTHLYNASIGILTLNFQRAKSALLLLNAQMLLSPIGVVVALITAATTAYFLFSESSDKAATSQSLFNDAMQEAKKTTAETIKQKELLLKVAKNENLSLKERQEAIDELNRTVPEYNNQLSLETLNTKLATEALDKHIESLKQSAVTYALEARIKKKAVELAEQEGSALQDNIQWYEELWAGIKNPLNFKATDEEITRKATENKEKLINATKEEIKLLEELYKKQREATSGSATDAPVGPKEGDTKTIDGKTFVYKNGKWTVKPSFTPTGGSGDKTPIDQAKKEAKELLKLQRQTEDQRLALINDAFKREMAINDENQRRVIGDLSDKASETLQAYDKAILSGDTDLAGALLGQYNQLLDQMDLAETEHINKRAEILENGIEANITKLKEQYNREETERQTAHNNELAALGTNEIAKQQLQDAFDAETLQRQKANQELLIAELQKALDTSQFQGFDLSILTDEQVQDIKNKMLEIGMSISEVNALLAKLQGKDTETVDVLGVTAGNIDVLGFSVEDWASTFQNLDTTKAKMEAVVMTATAMLNAYQMFSDFQAANEARRVQKLEQAGNRERLNQERMLDSRLISQQQYDSAVREIDRKLEKEKAEIAYNQAKREKAMALTGVAINTAAAIMSIWAQVPKVDFGISAGLLTGIVGVLGGVQAGLIAAQPLPAKGFEKGFYDNTMQVSREQDGKRFNAGFGGNSRSGMVNKPTVFLAGEGGKNFPELIISGPDYKQLNPDLKNSLNRELGRIKGFEKGFGYESDGASSGDSNVNMMMIQALQENTAVMRQIKAEGIEAYITRNFTNAKRMREDIKRLETIENKAKIN